MAKKDRKKEPAMTDQTTTTSDAAQVEQTATETTSETAQVEQTSGEASPDAAASTSETAQVEQTSPDAAPPAAAEATALAALAGEAAGEAATGEAAAAETATRQGPAPAMAQRMRRIQTTLNDLVATVGPWNCVSEVEQDSGDGKTFVPVQMDLTQESLGYLRTAAEQLGEAAEMMEFVPSDWRPRRIRALPKIEKLAVVTLHGAGKANFPAAPANEDGTPATFIVRKVNTDTKMAFIHGKFGADADDLQEVSFNWVPFGHLKVISSPSEETTTAA